MKWFPILVISTYLLLFLSSSSADELYEDRSLSLDESLELGVTLLNDSSLEVSDIDLARKLLSRSAVSGDPIGQFFLAQSYDSSCFGRVEICPYEKWLKASATGGNSTAQLLIGLHIYEQSEEHRIEGIGWVRTAAAQSDEQALIQIGRLFANAIIDSKNVGTRRNVCSALVESSKFFRDAITYELLLNSCGLLSDDSFFEMAIAQSIQGNPVASFLVAMLFEDISEPVKAIQYYGLSAEQTNRFDEISFLAHQLRNGQLDPILRSAYLAKEIQKQADDKIKQRLDRVLSQAPLLDQELQNLEKTDWEKYRDRPISRALWKAAEISLYALAIGAQIQSQRYATKNKSQLNNSEMFVRKTKTSISSAGYVKPSIGYDRNSSTNFFTYSQVLETPGDRLYRGKAKRSPANQAPSSCRCACVNGKKVSLCSSAIAVPALCSGICPLSVQKYQLPSVTPPPPGTKKCINAQVYSESLGRYEQGTICG